MTYDQILRTLVSGLLAHPENLRFEEKRHPPKVFISIHSHATDKPRLLGRGGKMISAIQAVVGAVALRRGETIKLGVENSTIGYPEQSIPYVYDPMWNRDPMVLDALSNVVLEIFPDAVFQAVSSGDTTTFLIKAKGMNPPIGNALDIIFGAWGKSQGRRLFVQCEEGK